MSQPLPEGNSFGSFFRFMSFDVLTFTIEELT